MGKPIVLITIDWFTPGFKAGGPVTSIRNLIDHLHNDFEFKILTSDTEYMESVPYPNIESDVWIKTDKYEIMYLSKGKRTAKHVRSVIESITFDVAYINGVFSKVFSIAPLAVMKGKRCIVATRGMFSPNALRIKKFKKQFFLNVAKLTGLYKHVEFHVTSDDEAAHVRILFGSNKLTVVPNLYPAFDERGSVSSKESGTVNLLYVGRIAPEKNTLFAIQALMSCKERVSLTVLGACYDEHYKSLCDKAVRELPENCEVIFLDPVAPEKVKTLLRKSHFMYLPTRGENYGHSIIEATLAGVPSLISDKTPWNNLQEHGCEVLELNEELFAKTIDSIAKETSDEYERRCVSVSNFASTFVKNNPTAESTKRLFGLN